MPSDTDLVCSEHTAAASADLAVPPPLPADRHPAAVYLASLAPTSRRTLGDDLNRIARLLTGGRQDARSLDWTRIRREHVQAIRAALSSLAPSTANRILAAVRGVLREAFRLGHMSAEDYARAVDVAPVRGRRLPPGRALSADEQNRLFAACDTDASPLGRRDAALLALGLGAGLRRAELVALRLRDYDPQGPTVRVIGKGNAQRENPIPPWAVARLDAWLPAIGESERMFPGLTFDIIYGALARRGREAGIPRFAPHDMRRTVATRLLSAGVDLAVVQQLMGHAQLATTARYDHRGDAAKRDAIARLA